MQNNSRYNGRGKWHKHAGKPLTGEEEPAKPAGALKMRICRETSQLRDPSFPLPPYTPAAKKRKYACTWI